jgi:hypothetical protein
MLSSLCVPTIVNGIRGPPGIGTRKPGVEQAVLQVENRLA